MQLKNTTLNKQLFAASCALLSGHATASDWDISAAVLYYGESDRVQALEGAVTGVKNLEDDKKLSLKLVVDSLTGASANGAVAQSTPQTFTTPSGNGQYQAGTGETPLDDTFRDTRVQLAGQWTQPLGKKYTLSTGANFSNEYDYQSLSFNGSLARDFNEKNTTVSLGLSFALDSIDAVGGRPIGLSKMVIDRGQFSDDQAFRDAFDATRQIGGEDGKDTVDVILGLTQIINKRWITQQNVSVSQVDGYLTDPYKVVSLVNTAGDATDQLFENRPDSRSKYAVYSQSKYHFNHSIWDISYRFTNDDWGISSHTIETRYRLLFNNNSYLEPHLRLYQQSEADFYTPFLLEGTSLPEFASADYRIGKLNTYTVGLKYGKKLKNKREYGVRLEYYSQAPQSIAGSNIGQLGSLDLFPSVDALILQFEYKF